MLLLTFIAISRVETTAVWEPSQQKAMFIIIVWVYHEAIYFSYILLSVVPLIMLLTALHR